MKTIVTGVLATALIACGSTAERKTELGQTKDSTSIVSAKPVLDTVAAIQDDSSIYEKYLPPSVKLIIKKELAEWRLLAPNRWENFLFAYYKTHQALINFVPGDFNGDGQKDYALLLANTKNELAVWVILMADTTHQLIKLNDCGTTSSPERMGISLVPKGELDYLDLDTETYRKMHIEFEGIQIFQFESAAAAYYWRNNRFESVVTAD